MLSLANLVQVSLVCVAAAAFAVLQTRVGTLEDIVVKKYAAEADGDGATQEGEEQYEKRIRALESEVRALKQQLVLARQLQPALGSASDVRSDADFVNIDGSSGTLKHYEIESWTPEQTSQWVDKVLGPGHAAAEVFRTIDGRALLDMLLDLDHSFTFGDKCFFMGIDRDACAVLERASNELLR